MLLGERATGTLTLCPAALLSHPLALIGPRCKDLCANQRGRRALHPVWAVAAKAEHLRLSSACSLAAAMLRRAPRG